MSIEEHDSKVIYCRMLGHQVAFAYCRQGASAQPCRKIFDCWFETFEIEKFVREHYTQEQIDAILTLPKPKMTTLIELIQQAKDRAAGKGTQA